MVSVPEKKDISGTSTTRVVDILRASAQRIESWVRLVRESPGRFKWAVESTRPANVISTGNILNGLNALGWLDRVLTDEDRREGIDWVRAMHLGGQQYRDPALVDRPAPGWPGNQPWPPVGGVNMMNERAHTVLTRYGGFGNAVPARMPPAGWPQPEDDPVTMLDWIRGRPWDTNPWGAGSHAMRMARWMLQWHKDGRFGLEPAIAAVRALYSYQDPETGLWGGKTVARQVRINGAFKVFVYTRGQLGLPILHADRLIDQVIAEMTDPDYDGKVGGCDEWDNWFVLRLCMTCVPGYRGPEIRDLAASRAIAIIERFQAEDGGMSFWPSRCCVETGGYDMAPSLPQGDAAGLPTLVASVCACVDLLDIADRVPWPAWEPNEDQLEAPEVRKAFCEALGLSVR